MWELDYKESWRPKHWKNSQSKVTGFGMWSWRRLLRVLWTANGSNQFTLKEISREYSWEEVMLTLTLQYFGHLMQRTNSLEKTLMLGRHLPRVDLKAGGEGDDGGWDGWMASPTRWTWVWVNSGSWWWTGKPGMLQSMGSQRVGYNWETNLNDPGIPLLDFYIQMKVNHYLEDICSPPCSLQHCNSQQTEMEITLSVHPQISGDRRCGIHSAAKSLQSCPTLCDRVDGSPPGSSVSGILQARTLEWVAISFSNAWKWKVKVKSLSRVRLLATPWTAAHQAPPSMGFSRQEYWSGVPLPSPGIHNT